MESNSEEELKTCRPGAQIKSINKAPQESAAQQSDHIQAWAEGNPNYSVISVDALNLIWV